MADDKVEVTQPIHHSTARFIKLIDNGDETWSVAVSSFNSLIPKSYDYVSLSYTGDNLTGVIYKTGGSGGTTVATLTLAYTGSTLISVTKT